MIVYVAVGSVSHEWDEVLGVFSAYEKAKECCLGCLKTKKYDYASVDRWTVNGSAIQVLTAPQDGRKKNEFYEAKHP